MKILQINVVCGVKSTGRIATDIALLAREKGHDCKVAYGRDIVPDALQTFAKKIGGKFSVRAHALYARLFDASGLGSKTATRKLVKWIKEYNPDVIHLHNVHGYYLHLPTLFSYLKQAEKKVVWTLHDCWAFTGHCSHFDFCGCDKWKTGCFACPQKSEYPKALTDKSKRNYSWKKETFTGVKDMTLVTPSKWLANLVKESFLKEYPVQVIPNGIDLTKFRPMESDLRDRYALQAKKIVLGVASAWGEKKGLQDFYRLGQLLGKEYQVVLVGLTEEQRKTAPKEVLALPSTNSIEDLAKWYTAADVFVNCTYEDTFSMVNMEAQACGTMAITYQTGGAVETVAEDCIVRKGDVQAMTEKIQSLINSPVQMQETCKDKNMYYERYLQVYTQKEER